MTVDLKALAATALLAGCATTAATPDPKLPPGSKGRIVAAMQGIKPQIGRCFDRYRAVGRYDISLTAGGDGSLQKLSVVGPDEPTARCVEDAARSDLRMPPSKDGVAPYSIVYPFMLR